VDAGEDQAIDYNRLIEKFGTQHIDKKLLQRFEELTGKKAHTFLRREIFFSHRYICLQSNKAYFLIILIGKLLNSQRIFENLGSL